MVTAQSPARMSAYLVTREGQELGTFKTSKIEKGLQTGFFRVSDLGWRAASGWQGLADIVGFAKAAASPVGAALMKSAGMQADDFNPFVIPMPHAQVAASGRVPTILIAELTHTRPWVRFISIVMGIGCLLMILVGLVLAADGASSSGYHLFGVGSYSLILTATCLLSTILILYPAVKLSNYAATIARLAQTHSPADLAVALTEQRRFWSFCGIVLLVLVCLTLLLFAVNFLATRVH